MACKTVYTCDKCQSEKKTVWNYKILDKNGQNYSETDLCESCMFEIVSAAMQENIWAYDLDPNRKSPTWMKDIWFRRGSI
jgi:hypothetical protein